MCVFRAVSMSEVYVLKSMGERTLHCGTPVLNRHSVVVLINFAFLDVVCSELSDVRYVCVYGFVNECIFTVSNALLLSSATLIMRVFG